MLDADGEIDRRQGRAASSSATGAELAWLEGLLHPRVVAEYMRWREELAALPDPPAVCATEVPLLYETGGDKPASTPSSRSRPRLRRERRRTIVADPGLREQRLIPDEEKLRRADFAYVNDGTLEELDAFVAGVIATLSV